VKGRTRSFISSRSRNGEHPVSPHSQSASYAYPTNLPVWMSSRRSKLLHETRLKYHIGGNVPKCRSRGWHPSTAPRCDRTPWIGNLILEYLLYVRSPNLVALGRRRWIRLASFCMGASTVWLGTLYYHFTSSRRSTSTPSWTIGVEAGWCRSISSAHPQSSERGFLTR
jgi:hypothetical protein